MTAADDGAAASSTRAREKASPVVRCMCRGTSAALLCRETYRGHASWRLSIRSGDSHTIEEPCSVGGVRVACVEHLDVPELLPVHDEERLEVPWRPIDGTMIRAALGFQVADLDGGELVLRICITKVPGDTGHRTLCS